MPTDYGKILESYLSSGSLELAVQNFTGPIRDDFVKYGTAADKLDFESAWSAVFQSAKQHPDAHSQKKLVTLLEAIKSLGELKQPDGSVCKHWAGTAWADLPALGAQMREEWNAAPPQDTPQRWTAINSFAARLTSEGLADFSLYAIWSLRDVLETPRPLSVRETEGGDALATKAADVSVDELLPAALEWLELCGRRLATSAQQGRSFVQEGQTNNPAALGPLAKEAGVAAGGGFSESRWNFWRERLREISEAKDDAGGREKIAKLAYQGVQKMELAEK